MESTDYDFRIKPGGVISDQFLALGITDFADAAAYIRHLPYGRNSDKTDICVVFAEGRGTCSTKHAVLHRLATENSYPDVKLILGLFKMNPDNAPEAALVLLQNGLLYLPEAHNDLKIDGAILDCTHAYSSAADFSADLLLEQEITSSQITDFKVNFHRDNLQKWLAEQQLRFTLDELWAVREACIGALSA